MENQNKRALITGASSGIGRDLAHIHAEHGGDLILVARSKEVLNTLKQELEEKYHVSVMVIIKDLSKLNAALELYEEIRTLGLQVDYLINNAGFGGIGLFYKRALEDEIAMINLNIVALTTLTHLYLNEMITRQDGRILNVSSTASFMPGPIQATYFATKSFVQFLSNAISEEIKGSKVTVTNLMPGATATKFAETAGFKPSGMFATAFPSRGVAEAGYNGMLAGKRDVLAGITLSQRVLLKVIPLFPKTILLGLVNRMQREGQNLD